MSENRNLIAYVASPHDGYLQLFRKYAGGELGIFGASLIAEFDSLTRHLPGNKPSDAARMIEALGIFTKVRILEIGDLAEFAGKHVVLPDEDVSRTVAERYLTQSEVEFDSSWKLRWDWGNTTFHRVPEGEIHLSEDEFDVAFMQKAVDISLRSPDWWRQVGGVLARDGKMLLAAYNTHLLSEQMAYICGDPRSNFNAGEHLDASLSVHAEMAILAEAARQGIRTKDCDLYVTTFPCPPCAGTWSNAGLKRLFYRGGYSLITAAETLKKSGVELYRILEKPLTVR